MASPDVVNRPRPRCAPPTSACARERCDVAAGTSGGARPPGAPLNRPHPPRDGDACPAAPLEPARPSPGRAGRRRWAGAMAGANAATAPLPGRSPRPARTQSRTGPAPAPPHEIDRPAELGGRRGQARRPGHQGLNGPGRHRRCTAGTAVPAPFRTATSRRYAVLRSQPTRLTFGLRPWRPRSVLEHRTRVLVPTLLSREAADDGRGV